MSQQTHTSLHQLKQFLQAYASSDQKDPFWASILQSDIRNILPKYEVCKIQLLKNNLSKIRLMMENLNTFISLQLHKKHLKQQTLDLDQNTKQQIQQLITAGRQNKLNRSNNQTQKNMSKQASINHSYDLSTLNQRKKQLQNLCKQLSKSKTSQQLKILIKKNKKWQQYLDKNIKQLQKSVQQSVHQDIMNLMQTYEGLFDFNFGKTNITGDTINVQKYKHLKPNPNILQNIILKSGSYTKIYENKLREKILIQKLVEDVFKQKGNTNNNHQQQQRQSKQIIDNNDDDYWKNQVERIRSENGI